MAALLPVEPLPADASASASSAYTVSPRRFAVLGLFALSSANNAFLWIQFSPVYDATAQRWALSALGVNMLSTVFMIAYAPASLLSLYTTERYGLRASILAGALLNCACCWLRYAACLVPVSGSGGGSYALLLLGQLLGALAQPFFTNTCTRLAGDWFPTSQRDGATVAASMANPVGNALGSIVPALVVASAADLPALLLWQAAASTAVLALTAWGVPRAPPAPHSAAAEARARSKQQRQPARLRDGDATAAQQQQQRLLLDCGGDAVAASAPGSGGGGDGAAAAAAAMAATLADLRSLLRDGNFLCLCVGFGVGLGVFNALLTLLAQVLAPCGYGDDEAGIAGAALLGAGLVTAGVAGVLLERTRAYVPILRAWIVGALAATLLMLGSLRPGSSALVTAAFALLGAALVPLLPVALENAAECSYPVPEDTSSALLLTLGNLVGIALIFACPPLLALPASASCSTVVTPAAGLVLGCMAVAAASVLLFKRDYRRQAAEAPGSSSASTA